jgi:lipopolysaccharide/colanic/teichoic acid biosynthesis glycosyltransferase/glycosyltransferase involved in cell wall biosynthesis
MHILYFHQYFCPPDGAGGTRSYEMARRLVEAGHCVTMVTSSAFFPDTYGLKRTTRLSLDGIDLVVLRVPYGNSMGFVRRILAFFQFAIRATWTGLKIDNPDLVFATSTPLTIVFPGFITSRVKAAPMVFEVRDLWPDLPIAVGALKNPVAKWLARRLERFAYAVSSHVIALSPGMKDGIVSNGVSEESVTMIPNASDTHLFRVPADLGESFLSRHPHLSAGPLVTYAGTLGHINGVSYLVEVAEAMRTLKPDVKFLICGDGAEHDTVKELARHRGVLDENLWMVPPCPKSDMPEVLSASTIAVSLFRDLPEMRHNSANKVFDALAAGRPIAVNYGGWQAELIESRGAGVVLPPGDPVQAAQELAEFLDDGDGLLRAREQAAALADSRFNRDKLAGELRTVLEQVVATEPAAKKRRSRSRALKRVFDIAASAIGLAVLSPVLVGISIAILIKMGRPVFFAQQRPGQKGRPFTLLKFRTMSQSTDTSGALLADSDRLTPLGQFLRKTSLDELPELFNVLIGDMSLVGPRPLLMEYLPYYSAEQARRHDVRPGITGLAQVRGRNALTWEDKFDFDITYVDTQSFALDLRILWETIAVVLGGKGVAAEGHATMPRFDEIMARREGAEDD